MILLLVLLVLAVLFLKGAFRIVIPILLGLLLLNFVIGTIFWLLSPHVLIPLLIIALVIWIWQNVKARRRMNRW